MISGSLRLHVYMFNHIAKRLRNGMEQICDNVIGSLLTNIQGIIFCMTPVRCMLSTQSFVTQLEMKAKNYHTRKYPTLSHIIVLTN